VFHLLRAGRRAVRALAGAADAAALKACGRDDFDALIEIVAARLREIEGWPEGHARTQGLAFFRGPLDDARSLREWERRMAADSSEPVDERDALEVLRGTKRLLAGLAGRLIEGQDHTLGKRDFSKGARPV
jgi:hypothetical protein